MDQPGLQMPLTKQDVVSYCRAYPKQGPALAHAYSDLTLSQRWLDLSLIEIEQYACCVLAGHAKPGAPKRFVLPMVLEERTSMEKLLGVIAAISPPPDVLTLGIVAPDSSIVYYNVKPGIVSPKEAPDEE